MSWKAAVSVRGDTNILIYAVNSGSPFHQDAKQLLEGWRRQSAPWYLTWGTCYEFLRLTTHFRNFAKPWPAAQAWSFLNGIFASPGLEMLIPTVRHSSVAAEILAQVPDLSGNVMHDLHTAVLMRENSVKIIYTKDTDFHRFPFLQPIDPIGPKPVP